jgi:hypothetical protein
MNDYRKSLKTRFRNENTGKYDIADLLRQIIIDRKESIDPELELRSFRNFWYDVKPILSSLGLLRRIPNGTTQRESEVEEEIKAKVIEHIRGGRS